MGILRGVNTTLSRGNCDKKYRSMWKCYC